MELNFEDFQILKEIQQWIDLKQETKIWSHLSFYHLYI